MVYFVIGTKIQKMGRIDKVGALDNDANVEFNETIVAISIKMKI